MAASKSRSELTVSFDELAGLKRVSLQTAHLSVKFLPELGGKMISLMRSESGREFLLQPPERPYRGATYGANFEEYDTSGFDECFPSVSACEYPGSDTVVPDHGELWSVPWQYEISDESLSLMTSGSRFPYIFSKRVSLDGPEVVLAYKVESLSDKPFKFLWSAHPLLAVIPGCQIVLPDEVNELFVNWSHNDRLGKFGDTCGWPFARDRYGVESNLAEVQSREAKIADKLFTDRLSDGYCAVYYPESDESIVFQFDTASVPYLGLWICQGGWPSPDRGHLTLALEPCSGRPDSLAEAAKREECQVLPPRETKSWQVRIQVQRGSPSRM